MSTRKNQIAIGFVEHDHQRCIRGTLAHAEQLSTMQGLRFTPVRRHVLELLLESHTALGAYDILARLADAGLGDKPPIAYRALAFLVDQGLAHRIERLNAYVACVHPGECRSPAFMICRACGVVAETETTPRGVLTESARASGFHIECLVQEAQGLCPACAGERGV